MQYRVEQALEVLRTTPACLTALMQPLSDPWIFSTEGENTWSPYDVLGHLIHGEKTDWIPRMNRMLSSVGNKRFEPFDRMAQFQQGRIRPVSELLIEFAELRKRNVLTLEDARLTEQQLDATGIHPEFGTVTLRQHLATWVAHDLSHLAQIARVMAKQYKSECGPWVSYLPLLGP